MAPTRDLAATMLRFFDNSNLQHQPGVPPEERRLNAMADALVYVTERDCGGVMFRLGDTVETVKGAKFWGEVIAFDTDEASPGCTVLAVDPGFAGTKHVYPLKQLSHRRKTPAPAKWDVENVNGKFWRVTGPGGKWSMKPEGLITAAEAKAICLRAASAQGPVCLALPESEWHEDYGDVVWWALDENGRWLGEAPYIGSPLDLGRAVLVTVDGEEMTCNVGGWPGYHTHWTPRPDFPPLPMETGSAGK